MKKNKKTFKEKFLGFIHSEGFKKFKKILDFVVYGYVLLITIVLVVGLAMPKKSQGNNSSNNSRHSSNSQRALLENTTFTDGDFLTFNVDQTSKGIIVEDVNTGWDKLSYNTSSSYDYYFLVNADSYNYPFYFSLNTPFYRVSDDLKMSPYTHLIIYLNRRSSVINNQTIWSWYFYNISLITEDNSEILNILNPNDASLNTSLFYCSDLSNITLGRENQKIAVFGDNLDILSSISTIQSINDGYDFSFGDVFNYNALWQGFPEQSSNSYVYVNENVNHFNLMNYDGYFDYSGAYPIYHVIFDLPYFETNGYIFNRIEIIFSRLDNNVLIQTLNSGFIYNHSISGTIVTYFYDCMYYVNTNDNLHLKVNQRNSTRSSDGTLNILLSTNWLYDEFKNVHFYDKLNDFETLVFNQVNNIENVTAGASTGVSDGIGLIATAISGLTSLLSIQIMPSITLGVLISIPLIVTLIIVLVRLVKK